MNTAGEVDQLRYAHEHGLNMMGETCIQYLFFVEDDLHREDGAKWVCSPPMRKEKDNERLWEGLSDNIIKTVSTDHCPFFYNGTTPIHYEGEKVAIPGKELGNDDFTKIPNGLPGVGDRMPVMWTHGVGSGRLTPNQFVALHCTNPAKIFGLYPQKGTLAPGSDADIAIWDPNKEVIYGVNIAKHRTDYNLYEGWQLKGFPVTVFLRGQKIVDNENWYGKPGMGRYLSRHEGEILS
jgi:dihydropyrimidinase